MSDKYCGSKDSPPKGKKFGTLKDCAEKGQLRRYGHKKINKKKVEKIKKDKPKYTETQLRGKISGLKTKIKKLNKEFKEESDKKKKDKIKEKGLKLNEELKEMVKLFKELYEKK